MNLTLPPALEAFIKEKVKSGEYRSASEVVRAALRLLGEQDAFKQRRREAAAAAGIRHSLKSRQAGGTEREGG